MVKYTGLDGYTLARNTQIPTCHFIVVFLLYCFCYLPLWFSFLRFVVSERKAGGVRHLKDTT